MNISRTIKSALAAAALSPMLFLTDCSCDDNGNIRRELGNKVGKNSLSAFQQDAPQQSHSLQELATKWMWETVDGDAASDFAISIEQVSDNEIEIVNFLNIDGERITAQVNDNQLTFQGEMAGGNLLIQNGSGNITNGWINIVLEYDAYDGESTEHHKVMLSKGREL
ncbi:MAG: hypothetical protein MJZ66_05400 [Bacteroidales bacterium]|nr:hypothetical protein [Bacteroidales bacterium]